MCMHNSKVLIIEAALYANILIAFRFSYIPTNHSTVEEAAINPLQRLIRATSENTFYPFSRLPSGFST